MEKSIGQLVDDLSIANIKIWHLQDRLSAGDDDKKVAEAARQIIVENTYRCNLVRAIDQALGQEASYSEVKLFHCMTNNK